MIETLFREDLPLRGRNGRERQAASVFLGHPGDKKESIQFKKLRVFFHSPFP
jgi:hypothetical protein